MDNRPIGVFDSGLGGLTSVQELHRQLPEERVIYLGDTARTPYGSKSPETIIKFAKQNVDYLVARNTKMIIIACNTVTAIALDALRKRYPAIPIIGVIEPTVKKVVGDGCKKVGVIATKETIGSDVYGRELRAMSPEIEVYSTACPAIVPLIEDGLTDTEIMRLTVSHYMDDFVKEGGFDNLILSQIVKPKMTMVVQPMKEISEKAVDILIQSLNSGVDSSSYGNINLSTTIEFGNSIRKL